MVIIKYFQFETNEAKQWKYLLKQLWNTAKVIPRNKLIPSKNIYLKKKKYKNEDWGKRGKQFSIQRLKKDNVKSKNLRIK